MKRLKALELKGGKVGTLLLVSSAVEDAANRPLLSRLLWWQILGGATRGALCHSCFFVSDPESTPVPLLGSDKLYQ